VVDEAADVAHAVAVNHNATVQVQTIVVPFARVFLYHPPPELFLTHHLTAVLNDERPYATTNRSDR